MKEFAGVKACVFDAYGTLFDVHSAVGSRRDHVGDAADAVSLSWRTKQLEYTWLRSLMGAYVPFWQVTQEALDYALEINGIKNSDLRNELMQAYLALDAYPEVPDVLTQLRDKGIRCVILTNGSPEMIEAAVESAGLMDLIEISLSVDTIGVYKPDPRVYQLACDTLEVAPEQIAFQSSNSWDAVGARYFGFNVAWINRFGQARERLPAQPDAELSNLNELLPLLNSAQ